VDTRSNNKNNSFRSEDKHLDWRGAEERMKLQVRESLEEREQEIKGEGSKPRIIKNGRAKEEKGQEKQGVQ